MRYWSEQTPHTLARIVSDITNPLYVAMPVFLVIAVVTAPDIWHALLWWCITTSCISLAPLAFIWSGVKRGQLTDSHVSIREQRILPMLFALGCFCLAFILLVLVHSSRVLIATMSALLVCSVVALFVTRHWKISLHLVGITGAMTALALIVGPLAYAMSPLVMLVAWARWEMRAHTFMQAVAGALLAGCVTIFTFTLFTFIL